ncbi:hypothetical protein [Okeania sp. KiyG1]|nr:hypothetical protein [Okeania sp. KiyG1]
MPISKEKTVNVANDIIPVDSVASDFTPKSTIYTNYIYMTSQ